MLMEIVKIANRAMTTMIFAAISRDEIATMMKISRILITFAKWNISFSLFSESCLNEFSTMKEFDKNLAIHTTMTVLMTPVRERLFVESCEQCEVTSLLQVEEFNIMDQIEKFYDVEFSQISTFI